MPLPEGASLSANSDDEDLFPESDSDSYQVYVAPTAVPLDDKDLSANCGGGSGESLLPP